MSDSFQILVNNVLTDIADLKVAQLKIELKKRGISTSGNKQDLYEKLKKYLANEKLDTVKEADNNTDLNISTNLPDNSINNETEVSTNVSSQDITTNNVTKDEETVEQPKINDKKLDEEAKEEIANDTKVSPIEEPFKESNVTNEPPNVIVSIEHEEKPTEKLTENGNSDNTPEEALSEEKATTNHHKAESNSEASFSRDASTERSESCIKEVPLSGDRNRFSRSKSPKARWHSETTEPLPEANLTENDQEPTKNESEKHTSSTSDETPTISDSTSLEQQSDQTSEMKTTNETVASIEGTDAPKAQLRKRKWLTNDAANVLSSKKPLTISSDTLKSYLPPSNNNTSNGETIKKDEENNHVNGRKETEVAYKQEDINSADSKQLTKQVSRTVIVEENIEYSKESTEQVAEATSEVEFKKEVETSAKLDKSIPTSNVLHINNLTRPFTLPQLKELLSKYGPLKKIEASNMPSGRSEKSSNEHYFWINSVKSHCYVAFEDLESAGRAYEGLHNTTWPQSNPKQLQVTYSTMDELAAILNNESSFTIPLSNATNNKLSKQQLVNLSNDKENETVNNKTVKPEKVDSSTKKETQEATVEHEAPHKTVQKVVREWDLPKYNNSDSRYYSSKSEETSKIKSSSGETMSQEKSEKSSSQKSTSKSQSSTTTSKSEEPPKTLDDLFRKTSAVPHIYWLPLTEEQFIEKQKESERRMIERKRRAEERQQKEAELTTTTASANKPNEDTSSAARYNKRKLDAQQAEESRSDDEESRKTTTRNSNKNGNEDVENNNSSTKQQRTTNSSNKNRRKSLSSEPPRRRERSESISS